ncbi:hypothetical protein M407DRAFT_169484 [Tulasnella calospora MUT 4182]|uniref:Uncharacterized protein n=1 Tax=Tulasnella calospora MUT 4182 TaxID=1051891 RepID=A0A0C3QPR2_9AGAM|nr:hypothetical protein M407DRAFT_169484 [Tulasnella calospora MUT 4182]
MTMPVADFLANRVFCILPRPNIVDASGMPKYKNIGQRCTARELGEWLKSLPMLMGQGGMGMGMGMGPGMGAPGVVGGVSRSGLSQRMGSKLAIESASWRSEEDDALHVPSVTPVPARSTATLVVAEQPALAPAHSIAEGSKANATEVLSTNPADAEAGGHSGPGEGDADQESLRSPSTKRRGKRGARRKDKSLPPSTPSQNPSFNDLSSGPGVPPLPTAADVENLASEISRATGPVLRSRDSRTSVASGRSRLSRTEKLVARLPPPPSMAPPAPPVEGVTVKGLQELGKRMSMEEEQTRSASPRPMSIASSSSIRSVPISIATSANTSVSRQRKAPASPPNLFSPLHHYRPDPPKGPPPKPPVAAPPSSFAQQHPGAMAILGSAPALPSKKSWMGRLLSSGNSTTTNSPPPVPHAAPGAHQSPATLSSGASRASIASASRSSLASSTMESAARSGLLIRETSPVRAGPNGTVRAASRASNPNHPYPGLQWTSTEDDLAPKVNDLDVMPPPASTTWRKNPPPSAQWSTAEEPVRAAPAAEGSKPPAPKGFISSAVAFNAEQVQPHPRRKMDANWRSSVSTMASSGSGSIMNSAGTLSSASSTFTRFSNSSVRSVSTTATSASAMSRWGTTEKGGTVFGGGADGPSWRPMAPPVNGVDSGFVGPEAPPRPRKAPMQSTNVKRMDGMPRELGELPRSHQPRIKGVLPDMPTKKNGYAQQRGHRSSPPLDPISEKHNSTSQSPPPSPDAYRNRESAASTTDLDPALDASSTDPRSSPDLKKQGSQKSQSNAFQKFPFFKQKGRD